MTTSREPGESRLLYVYFAAALVFLLGPLILIVPMSVSETRYLSFPPVGFTLDWFVAFLGNTRWMRALGISTSIALAAAFVAVPIGVAASLYLRNRSGFLPRLFLVMMVGSQVVPTIIVALGVRLITARFSGPFQVVSVIMVHATLALPFVLVTVLPVLNQLDEAVEKAARVCGASPFKTFRYITLPAIAPALIGAFIFSFFISFDELVIALFTLQSVETMPVRIWGEVRQELTPVVAAATTLLLLTTSSAVIVGQAYIVRASTRALKG